MNALDNPEPGVLQWCHGCGDWVAELFDDSLCILCLELDARLDSHVGAAMEDFAEGALGVVLDYLNVQDVNAVIRRMLKDPYRRNHAIPLLRERFMRADAFIDKRSRETKERAQQQGAERDERLKDAPSEDEFTEGSDR